MRRFIAFADRFEKVPGLAKPFVRRLVVGLALLVLLAAAAWLVVWLIVAVPGRFWQLLALAILISAVLWWFLRGARRFEQRGVSRKRLGDLGPGDSPDEAEAVRAMTQAIAAAKSTVMRSPQIERGADPLYRVPWFLVIGDQEAGQEQFLRVATRNSPFQAPQPLAGQAHQFWQWWFFRQLVAIQTSERFVCDSGQRLERGIWYQALQLLGADRPDLALNGIVVAVSVHALLRNDEAFRNRCVWLRRLVDEAMEHLQLQLPVYFVVTRLDALPGFAHYVGAMPTEVDRQAVGWRFEADVRTSAASSGKLGEIFEAIVRRLHALRLTAVKAELRPAQRKGVYDFVEAFKRLRPGLETFVRLLLEDNPFQRTPQWRGLYFVATESRPAFVEDLVTRFLPVDQPLATKNERSRFWRWSRAAVGVAAVLAVSIYVSRGIVTAAREDVPVVQQTEAACPAAEGLAGAARISWVAACGREIDAVESVQERLAFGFGIRRSDERVRALKKTLVDDFSRLILAPYDQTLEQDVAGRKLAFDHFLAVAQRLRLMRQCRSDAAACRRDALGANYVFDPRSRLYAPFTAVATTQTKEAQSLDLLQAYIGYVRWQDGGALEQEEERLKGLLRTLLEAHQLQPADVARWAQARPTDLTLARFWRPGTSTAAADARLPSVSAAYVREAWLGAVSMVHREAADAVPEKKTALDAFFEAYQREYYRHWGAFLRAFPDGVALWAGRYGELVGRAGSADASPYGELWKALDAHVYGLPIEIPTGVRWAIAWGEIKADWMQTHRSLWRFLRESVASSVAPGVVKPPAWVPAVLEYRYGLLREQAPAFARAYLRLQADNAGEASYPVAAEIFRTKGNPAQPPAAEYAPLLHAVDKPNEKYAPLFSPDDQAAWSVVQGPSRLLLFLTLYRAGQFLQAKWDESIVAPTAKLPQKEQIDVVYGEKGRFAAYVDDWLRPFVSEKERQPVKVAGVALPLGPSYQDVLTQERTHKPLPADKLFPAGVFQFWRDSTLGRLSEGAEGTTLEVDCKERKFAVKTRAGSLVESSVEVYWSPVSCTRAYLQIALPDPPPPGAPAAATTPGQAPPGPAPAPATAAAPPAPSLVRIYAGPEGFLQLLHDFGDGSHTFRLGEFRGSYLQNQWQEVAQRAGALGVEHAQVYLRIRLSEEMQRYLGKGHAIGAVPSRIFE